jgi:YVTN family beta-propeller protein
MRSSVSFVASLTIAVAVSAAAQARPLLAVGVEAGEVVLIDPAKAQVVERIKVGARARGLKLTRDRRRLLVAVAGPAKGSAAPAAGSSGLAIVDLATRKVTKQVATPPAPFGVDLSSDERTAFLSNSETNEILVIDLGTGTVKKKIPIGTEPLEVATRPDGKAVYAAARAANELSAIDPKTMTSLARVDAGMRPRALVFAPREKIAFAVNEAGPTITIIDTKQNISKEMFVLQEPTLKTPAKTPGLSPQSAVLSPDGKLLYVTTGPARSVLIVDPAKKAVVGVIAGVGWFPRGIAVRPDGKKLYTANGPSDDVAIIDVASRKVEATVAVPGGPYSLVFIP